MDLNSAIFGIALLQKLFHSHKNICFEAIRKSSKSNRMLQAWTDVCDQILGKWKL